MYRVMLVDDEPWALQGLASLITELSDRFRVVATFENPSKAVEGAAQLRPDVIFTDVRMPGMTGIELIRAVRGQGVDTEAVIISAYRSFEAARDALDLSVRSYLLKPFERAEVSGVLAALSARLEEKRQTAQPLSALLERAAVYPVCCLFVSDDPDEAPPDEKGVTAAVLPKGPAPLSLLCSFDSRQRYRSFVDARQGPGRGFSRPKADFSGFERMSEEALASLSGGFVFSDSDEVAEVQWSLLHEKAQKVDAKRTAGQFYLSQGYLSHLFKKETGVSMVTFFHRTRMNQAARALRTTGETLVRIAEDAGYTDYNYFSRLFKRFLGMSPDQYRRTH